MNSDSLRILLVHTLMWPTRLYVSFTAFRVGGCRRERDIYVVAFRLKPVEDGQVIGEQEGYSTYELHQAACGPNICIKKRPYSIEIVQLVDDVASCLVV